MRGQNASGLVLDIGRVSPLAAALRG